MPSNALADWRGSRYRRLKNLWAVHGGFDLPWQRQQVELLLVVKMAAEFQAFSRDLHDLSVDFIASLVSSGNARLEEALDGGLADGRRLNQNNAGPDTLAKDFFRIGLQFWPSIESAESEAREWRGDLGSLIAVRNAIVHGDDEKLLKMQASGLVLDVAQVRTWQNSLDGLAVTMDEVVAGYLADMTGVGRPW